MKATERFTQEIIFSLQEAIEDAGFNEVFAYGKLDSKGLVSQIEIAARGDKTSVSASGGFADRGDVIIHNHPSGFLEPSQADINIASRLAERGIGSYIVDGLVNSVYVIVEPIRKSPLVAIKGEELVSVLCEGGKLASLLGDYEVRNSQLDLVRAIAEAMNEGYPLAAEAGTGVGKSFAYLLAAFAWAVRNKERVVISTATINLQNQLIEKDIPLVSSIFKKKLKAVLVKGRGNYVCLSRLEEALDEEGLLATEDSEIKRIYNWTNSTKTGDISDLSFWPDKALWARVHSESDECLNIRCPHRENCFVLKSKREASDADIIVANHHMLFSDIAARANGAGYEGTAILPPYHNIIFDEAHAIESSVTSLFSDELTKFSVFKQTAKLYRERHGRKFGTIVKLQNITKLPTKLVKSFGEAIEALKEAVAVADSLALEFLGNNMTRRIKEKSPEVNKFIIEPMLALEKHILTVTDLLKKALDAIPDSMEDDEVVEEGKLALVRMSNIAGTCFHFREFSEDTDGIYWIEKGKTSTGEYFVTFYRTPLEIASIVSDSVWNAFRSVVCLSATLSINGSFNYWKNRIGLNFSEHKDKCLEFPSPFPYKTNALLAATNDAPDPHKTEWQSWINKAVYKLIKASGGRALVLFTSYSSLEAAWNEIKPNIEKLGINCLRQGAGERTKLMETFKTDITSVLFATNSFWEGIDAKGETLELVIITKLPFKVPSDPVQEARAEALEARGGNSFMEMSLPETIIQFKQGFGRLIRHSHDKGSVVVLDSRLLTKRYGSLFIKSLPETRTCFGSIKECEEAVKKFIEN